MMKELRREDVISDLVWLRLMNAFLSITYFFLGFSLLFFSDDDVQCHFTQLFFQTSLGEWDRSRIGWMFMKSALLSFGLLGGKWNFNVDHFMNLYCKGFIFSIIQYQLK